MVALRERVRAWGSIYLKGICMGAADLVPGVSGGTIALIVGIYDRLVNAIASFDPRTITHLRAIHHATAREAVIADLRRMDLGFLLVLGAGIITAVVVLSRVILFVLAGFEAQVHAFFFGLIGASALLLYREVAIDTLGRAAVAVVGFILAFGVSGLALDGGERGMIAIFVAGAIAITAMILPGISGALILLMLGKYEFMLDALRAFIDSLAALPQGGSFQAVVDASGVVGTFMVGAVLGLLTTAKIVSWALDRYRMATLGFLVSLMVGALRVPIERTHAVVGVPGTVEAVGIVLGVLIGVAAVYALDRATESLEYT